jgi:HAD superfamily hydrolase (TIGR01509 family)
MNSKDAPPGYAESYSKAVYTGSVSFDLVIFDCDGVLVDSEPPANRVFAAALNEIGLPCTYEEVCRDFIGLSLPRCIEIVESRRGEPLPAGFVDELQRRTFDAFERELQPVPGIHEALRRISMPLCVASSGDHEKMRLTLDLTGLLPRFEGRMFSAMDVERGKPHPDLFMRAASEMGAAAERCAVVEDSLPGVRAAVAAGMTVFGYAARAAAGPLEDAGATVFTEMAALPGLLGKTT